VKWLIEKTAQRGRPEATQDERGRYRSSRVAVEEYKRSRRRKTGMMAGKQLLRQMLPNGIIRHDADGAEWLAQWVR